MYKNQQHFIDELEKAGELIRIKEFVDPHLEIAEVVDRISKNTSSAVGRKALLFENTGTDFPLLINAFGSEKRMCMALGVKHLDDVAKEIENMFHFLFAPKKSVADKLKAIFLLQKISSWMPKEKKGRGECQQVVMKVPDITKFPIMKCWPHDGGKFLTLPVVHTIEPNTGIRNVGMYRMQVFGTNLTAIHWHMHKVAAGHFNEYKKLGKKMPVAVALGGDPVYAFSAASPLPPNTDEYLLAGFLRKKRVELVKCLTQEMFVPADADIVIEGYVDPNEEFILEGPFGDHTGYYSLADYYPKFHITCITHKKNAVYPSAIVGIPPQEDWWIGKAIERIFLALIKMTIVPEITDMEMPVEGVFHNLTIVKIKKEFVGHSQKVMNAMWGAGQMMLNKILIITDGDVDIHNYEEVARSVSENVNPGSDIYFSRGPMDVLDHACSEFAFGGKMCIDATSSQADSKKTETVNSKKNFSFSETDKDLLISDFSEIKGINFSLLQKGISVLFISVEKNRKNHIYELNEKLFSRKEFSNVKFVIYVEHKADVKDIKDCTWRFANNFDPGRDSYFAPVIFASEKCQGIGLDGTRKTKQYDDFQRDWPNIISADETTIKSVDEKWNKLFPFQNKQKASFIFSPSLKYKEQLYKGDAVVNE